MCAGRPGLIQGGGGGGGGAWIGCLVTPLWVTLSTRTIKHAIYSQGNRAKQKTERQCTRCLSSGYGNTVGILVYYNVFCVGGGTSPFHVRSPPQFGVTQSPPLQNIWISHWCVVFFFQPMPPTTPHPALLLLSG